MKAEDKAGLYITIIAHLVVVIILLCIQLGSALTAESSFVLDFSAQEEYEAQLAREKFEQDIASQLEDMISGKIPVPQVDQHDIRNTVVDASLKDAKGIDADKLYDEARKLQEALHENAASDSESVQPSQSEDQEQKPSQEDRQFSGPSVVSYNLDGRKAVRLNIPAYKCMGGGDVAVVITVDAKGHVTEAAVIEGMSSKDTCLREYALRAARSSIFTADPSTPKQKGDILYRFIAQ